MYPLSAKALPLGEIATHWARDLPQRPPPYEVLEQLVGSLFRGDLGLGHPILRGELELGRPMRSLDSRRYLLEQLVSLPHHEWMVIFPDAASERAAPKRPMFDFRTFIILPADKTAWATSVVDAACAALCARLAVTHLEGFSSAFLAMLRCAPVAHVEFERYCLAKDYALPPFWFGPRYQQLARRRAPSDCKKWLRRLAATVGAKPAGKEALRQQAKERFPHLSDRGFEQAWASAVPPSWRDAGSPKGPRGSTVSRSTPD
jgi:hypothetical protein